MEGPDTTELLLMACELAVHVECIPIRDDGTSAAVYSSSGPTVARRIKAGAAFEASCNAASAEPGQGPEPFCWTVSLRVGAARKTRYKLWLRESPDRLEVLWREREAARALRASLPHDQRKKKPWGPL